MKKIIDIGIKIKSENSHTIKQRNAAIPNIPPSGIVIIMIKNINAIKPSAIVK